MRWAGPPPPGQPARLHTGGRPVGAAAAASQPVQLRGAPGVCSRCGGGGTSSGGGGTSSASGRTSTAAAGAAATGRQHPDVYVRLDEGVAERYTVQPKAVFAVVEVGGTQYKVTPGDVIIVEKLADVDVNDKLQLQRVLLLGSRAETIIGRPYIPAAAVTAAVEVRPLAPPGAGRCQCRVVSAGVAAPVSFGAAVLNPRLANY